MQEFIAAYIALTDAGLANGRTKVSRIIHYLKHEVKTFHFEAIRAYGTKSKGFRSKFAFSRFFVPGRENSIIDFKPAIQICFYSKNALGLRSYRIIYPEMYSQDEVV